MRNAHASVAFTVATEPTLFDNVGDRTDGDIIFRVTAIDYTKPKTTLDVTI